MHSAKKNRNRCCKTTCKRVVQKTAETTRDLIGNRIIHKITSLSKKKSKEKVDKRNLHTTRKTDKQVIDDLRLF